MAQYYAIKKSSAIQHADGGERANHKYVKREMVNGKWRYFYDDGSSSVNIKKEESLKEQYERDTNKYAPEPVIDSSRKINAYELNIKTQEEFIKKCEKDKSDAEKEIEAIKRDNRMSREEAVKRLKEPEEKLRLANSRIESAKADIESQKEQIAKERATKKNAKPKIHKRAEIGEQYVADLMKKKK